MLIIDFSYNVYCVPNLDFLKSEVITITNKEVQENHFNKKHWKQNQDLKIEFACVIPLHVS